MPSALATSVFLGTISVILALLAQRSPFLMASTPASGARPWADGPMKLVGTPLHETGKTDLFATGASHMALLHNTVFRGYNSIYLQVPHVRDADKADFVGYCQTWFKLVKSHHDDEEQTLFTRIEELLGDKTVFDETHKEHESFMTGLVEFNTYLTSLPTPQALDAARLVALMDAFAEPFETHFHNEIGTIARLADHPGAPRPGTPEADEAALTFKTWGKATVTKAGTTDVVPFFLLNLDRTTQFEDGRWAAWPPIPAPIRWGLINVGGWLRGGYWKFASCDAAGNRRELYALQGTAEG